MSIDSSLKTGGSLAKHRNVLSRAERITKLAKVGKFSMESGSPIGLPKVGNRKVVTGGKTAKKAEGDAAAAAPGAAAAAPAAAAAAKPAGKTAKK